MEPIMDYDMEPGAGLGRGAASGAGKGYDAEPGADLGRGAKPDAVGGRPLKVMAIFGTRPDAAKMCPLIKVLEARGDIATTVCLTGQHREQLRQVIDVFGTRVDYSLDVMRPEQTLFSITTDVLSRIEAPLRETAPDIALVHGDTTTSFVAALACFYLKIPVAHVEAGLRTFDAMSPFPEEMSRTLIARVAALNFAPTEKNRGNLLREAAPGKTYVTGNTAIDAFATTLRDGHVFANPDLRRLTRSGSFEGRRVVLVTAHRSDNIGQRHEQVFRAIRRLHDDISDSLFVYPVHLNPKVREPARRILGGLPRVCLTEPLDLLDMHNLMKRCYIVMTDSGGLQEEAPFLGAPTLVFRTETERPEAVEAGTVRVVGVKESDVYDEARRLFFDKVDYESMATAKNPYGDGHASERIVSILLDWAAQNGIK